MKHLRNLPLVLLGALALSGCTGAPSWVRGDWRLDHDRTVKEMSTPSSPGTPSPGGFGMDLGKMMSGLTTMLGTQIVNQLTTMEVIINGTDLISTLNGQGESHKYKIIERSADKCVIRLDDNSVETYYRSGDEIYVYPSGGATFKIYLQRAK